MNRLDKLLPALLLACGCGDPAGPSGPAPFQLCSGHGTYQLADNAQSACTCDPGYSEQRWKVPATMPLNLENSFLCVADPPPLGLGMARPDGEPMKPEQANLVAAAGLPLTEVALPVDPAELPARLTVVGRIALEGAGMTGERAGKIVDQAMNGRPDLHFVLLDDPILRGSQHTDVPGISDGQKLMEWLEQTHMPAICAAISRAREHCPWCAVGLTADYSSDEHLHAMGSRLVKSGKLGECRIDFVEQHFHQVNPFLVDTGAVP